MRISWHDHLRVGLAPGGIAVAGYRRGLRPTLVAKDLIPVEPSAEDLAPWRAAVEALPAALALCGRGRPRVTVVVSNHFVRYALLPWNDALGSEAEWLALARHRFSIVHGPATEEWTIRISETGRGQPRVASAIDAALLAAVEEQIGAKAALVSVQPYLMAVFNRMRPVLGRASCWLALDEPQRLTLALIQNGVWQAIRGRRTDAQRRWTLAEMIERESALLSIAEPCTQVLVHSHLAVDAPAHGAYELRDLTPATADGDRQLAMALE